MNKRFINKDNLKLNYDYIAKFKLSDILIYDDKWCSNFFNNFNWNIEYYQNLRNNIIEKYNFNSNLSLIENDKQTLELESLANILVNLENNPTWLDIILTNRILKKEINETNQGNFNKLVLLCKENIKNKFNE